MRELWKKKSYTDVLPVTHPAYGQMLQMASSKSGALESILFTVFGSSPSSVFKTSPLKLLKQFCVMRVNTVLVRHPDSATTACEKQLKGGKAYFALVCKSLSLSW